jgi:hypothetical protein
MKIFGYTSYADQARDQFYKAASDNVQPRLSLLYKKMMLCDYEILLVSHYPLNLSNLNDGWYDPQKLIDLHAAFAKIHGEGLTDVTVLKRELAVIDEIGETVSPDIRKNDTPFVRKFREDPTGKRFFIGLTGHEPEGFLATRLNFLCNLWAIENAFIPIHSASVIHEGKLFLFCGPHGAGKSTIATISKKGDDIIIDEDILLLPRLPATHFIVQAWGYSLETSTAPLCAIFKIVQDDEDWLIPLPQTQTAHFLLDRSIEIMGYPLHDRTMDKLFKQIATIVRYARSYELHFRKSPDFWKLIDEQISA